MKQVVQDRLQKQKMKNVFLVIVEYGNEHSDRLDRLISRLQLYRPNIIRVRNDISPGYYLRNPNESLEFSGYQEGLFRAIDIYKKENLGKCDQQSGLSIVFVNDTIVSSHICFLSRFFLNCMLSFRFSLGTPPVVSGFQMPTSKATQLIAGDIDYLTTWGFVLIGPLDIMNRVRFYEREEVLQSFGSAILPNLPVEYRREVHDWIQPRNIFHGWYKSIPWVTLPEATSLRKKLTIYLEHTMPLRLSKLGFVAFDVGHFVSPVRRILLNVLRFIDRLYTNIRKWRYRLSSLL